MESLDRKPHACAHRQKSQGRLPDVVEKLQSEGIPCKVVAPHRKVVVDNMEATILYCGQLLDKIKKPSVWKMNFLRASE